MTYQRPGVYISERTLPAPIASTGTANAAGAVIAQFEKGPATVTLVSSWYDFAKKFGGYNAAFRATYGVAQFFKNGGTELYVRRVLAGAASATVALTDGAETDPVAIGSFTAKNPGEDGNNLRVQVSAAAVANYYNLSVYMEETGGDNADSEDDTLVEVWQNVVFNNVNSSDYIGTVLALSEYVSFALSGDGTDTPDTSHLLLSGGDNGDLADAEDFEDAVEDFTALDRPLVVFSPDAPLIYTAAVGDDVYKALDAWASTNNSFVVADTAPGLTAANALSFAQTLGASAFTAVYYPNLFIQDPLGRSTSSLVKVGPSGSVAGLYIATDRTAGPFKAPAGVRTGLVGVVAPEKLLTSAELDSLNVSTTPVNAIRSLPGAGTVVYGARTLLQDGTANKYVNMRRSLNFLRKRISDLTQFAVFENNNDVLWRQVRTVIGVFLNEYRNQGGLRGATPGDAYFIKCDAENNPAQSIAQGIVNIEVGVALEYPAEYVVISLSQKTIS
jgi:phage tail sheath protein FI